MQHTRAPRRGVMGCPEILYRVPWTHKKVEKLIFEFKFFRWQACQTLSLSSWPHTPCWRRTVTSGITSIREKLTLVKIGFKGFGMHSRFSLLEEIEKNEPCSTWFLSSNKAIKNIFWVLFLTNFNNYLF